MDTNRWRKDDSGNLVMPRLQSEYLDWLLDDQHVPSTEVEWCTLHNLPRDTVRKWRQDRRFKEQWERRALERNLSPERIQKVVDVLYQSAVGTADTQAAKQFLLHVEKYLPPREVRRDASVAHMSDSDLRAEVEGILASGFGATEGEQSILASGFGLERNLGALEAK